MERDVKVKICGITTETEIGYLNESEADYAGVVFWEKSKRYVTLQKAKKLKDKLINHIKTVAVMVSPEIEFVKEIENAGFDILQIHGELKPEVINKAVKPIWYAQNIKNSSDIADFGIDQNISAIVIDGEKYGGGKTFDWTADAVNKRMDIKIPIVLAGGLNSKNVIDGIEKFQPDIVDVSTGVEGTSGKDKKLILDFIERVKHE